MATKGKTDVGERSNRVRFVMLEADLSDTNVNALAHAIVSALKPEAPSTPRRLAVPSMGTARLSAPAAPSGNGRGEQDEHDASASDQVAAESTDDGNDEQTETTPTSTTRARKPTKPPVPEYLDSLFPTAADADAFKAFVAQHPTKKTSERYLVAALYLRDHTHPIVNMNKIYTCYRAAGWPVTITDWDVNLRSQLQNDRFRRVDGGYSITTVGEGVVQQLRTAA